jgi:hypothetical protein
MVALGSRKHGAAAGRQVLADEAHADVRMLEVLEHVGADDQIETAFEIEIESVEIGAVESG